MTKYNSTELDPKTNIFKNHCAITEVLPKRARGLSCVPTMEEINGLKKDFKAVSFFSGCGGASIGLKMAKFNVLYANEFVPAAVDTYRANHPNTYVDSSDIRTLKGKAILKRLGLERGELDLVDMSPPCKGFSTAGVQDDGWSKEVLYSDGIYQRVDDLFDEGVRLLKELKPKVFIAENVTGLVKGASRGYFLEILDQFDEAGYHVRALEIDPVRLGVPQTRNRLIYIGVRKDLRMDVPAPTLVPKHERKTVRDVLPHIVKIKTNLKDNIVGYVDANIPSPTIVASDFDTSETARFSCGGWCEDNKGRRRKYTLWEVRRLMTVPDDFKLTGSPRQQWERLGRIHAPLQVFHLAKALREQVLIPFYKRNKVKPGHKLIKGERLCIK